MQVRALCLLSMFVVVLRRASRVEALVRINVANMFALVFREDGNVEAGVRILVARS